MHLLQYIHEADVEVVHPDASAYYYESALSYIEAQREIENILGEFKKEKIDVIRYSEDPAEFVAAALSPATVLSVEIDPELPKACRVTVPDHQLSLAIGNKGHNARLAARLTGWKIDIRPESGYYGEDDPEPSSND